MELSDIIKTRRSRRKYLNKKVSDDIITRIIDSARYAPFGGPPKKKCQLWEFIVIRDAVIKEKLALNYEDRQFIKEAPVLIAVCADRTKDPDYKDWDITASLAIENMLLTVHDLGLGACYITTFSHDERFEHKKERKILIQTLNLPQHIELVALISIGYPDPSEEIKEKELRDIDEMIHHEKY